jgi:hypothetical protein
MEGIKITTFSAEYFVKTTLQAYSETPPTQTASAIYNCTLQAYSETLPTQIASAVYNCRKIQGA